MGAAAQDSQARFLMMFTLAAVGLSQMDRPTEGFDDYGGFGDQGGFGNQEGCDDQGDQGGYDELEGFDDQGGYGGGRIHQRLRRSASSEVPGGGSPSAESPPQVSAASQRDPMHPSPSVAVPQAGDPCPGSKNIGATCGGRGFLRSSGRHLCPMLLKAPLIVKAIVDACVD
jgi:hypothetical protein